MLEGWYCRNQQNNSNPRDEDSDDESPDETNSPTTIDYKEQYRYLKKKLKSLIYENESFQDALRSSQRRLLKVTRDRSFLLDRLLQYEKPSSSDTDETESSGDEIKNDSKRQKVQGAPTGSTRGRKRKNFNNIPQSQQPQSKIKTHGSGVVGGQHHDSHVTPEEMALINKHLQSRQTLTELVPERNVPNEMFSNEPSLDSESNDQVVETPPSD